MGPKKCFVLQTKKGHEEYLNFQLFVDGWEIRDVQDVETGGLKREDTLQGNMEISHIDKEKYLGQIISSDGKNTKHISKMRNKGIGLQNKVIQMLETMPGGKFHFVIAKILRNSLVISSILSSSEVWYGVTTEELRQLEEVDEIWMRKLLDCSYNVPRDLLFLELEIVPIRFIVQMRRLLYLHHILQQKKDSLLYRFFMAQLGEPTPKDWVSQVLEDLEELEISFELDQIEVMKKEKFKLTVKEAV